MSSVIRNNDSDCNDDECAADRATNSWMFSDHRGQCKYRRQLRCARCDTHIKPLPTVTEVNDRGMYSKPRSGAMALGSKSTVCNILRSFKAGLREISAPIQCKISKLTNELNASKDHWRTGIRIA